MSSRERNGRWAGRSAVGVAIAGLVALSPPAVRAGAAAPRAEEDDTPVSAYPAITGGTWRRGANLKDREGRPQARQEHAAAVLNGFVYLIGGFVPIQPAPQATEDNPEPFPFVGTGEVLVYTPRGQQADAPAVAGEWVSLPDEASFPMPDMHHIVAVAHGGKIWAIGGHAGPFTPTADVFVFTPASATSPTGTWGKIRVSDGQPCGQGEECLGIPTARAAGAAVSVGNRIFLIGGVEPAPADARDPVNESIRTTASVLALDTTAFPLRWEEAPSLNESREHFNAVVAADRIWVFQGRNERDTNMRGVESLGTGDTAWRQEQDAPVGASANILAAVGDRVFSFGGEFIASNITGTLTASQVFDVSTRQWSRLQTTVETTPLDATGADAKHGTYGVTITEEGVQKIMAPGGATTAWFDPTSKVHVFTPP
jgi:hypothetical protein